MWKHTIYASEYAWNVWCLMARYSMVLAIAFPGLKSLFFMSKSWFILTTFSKYFIENFFSFVAKSLEIDELFLWCAAINICEYRFTVLERNEQGFAECWNTNYKKLYKLSWFVFVRAVWFSSIPFSTSAHSRSPENNSYTILFLHVCNMFGTTGTYTQQVNITIKTRAIY